MTLHTLPAAAAPMTDSCSGPPLRADAPDATAALHQRLAAARQWLNRHDPAAAQAPTAMGAGTDGAPWSNWRNWINS